MRGQEDVGDRRRKPQQTSHARAQLLLGNGISTETDRYWRGRGYRSYIKPVNLDLIVRNGTIVDGLGGEPYVGDIAVKDGVIVAVGAVDGHAVREIEATSLLVTPGFVDLHTHYDGQAIWSDRLTPSSAHGVTTAVMGNCGVGFAPCRAEDHETLVDLMAGVEDIPGVVMVDGLTWNWETFPEFLDALESRRRDIDVAAFLPHSPLRVYVMGRRGVDREPATAEDLALLRKLAAEAVEVGALGFASSRSTLHKSESGSVIPSVEADRAEIEAIARGIADAGGGLIQFVPDLVAGDYRPVLQTVFDVAAEVGLPVTFTLAIANAGKPYFVDGLKMVEEANAAGGDVSAQIFPRPIGLIIGLELSGNPFVMYPSYQALAHLPLAERVAECANLRSVSASSRTRHRARVIRSCSRCRTSTGCFRSPIRRTTNRRCRRASRTVPPPAASAPSKRRTTGSSTTTATPCC